MQQIEIHPGMVSRSCDSHSCNRSEDFLCSDQLWSELPTKVGGEESLSQTMKNSEAMLETEVSGAFDQGVEVIRLPVDFVVRFLSEQQPILQRDWWGANQWLFAPLFLLSPAHRASLICIAFVYCFITSTASYGEAAIASVDTADSQTNSNQKGADGSNGEGIGYYDRPIEIAGMDLPSLVGKAYEDWILVTFDGEKITPVPFQFDEYNEEGFPYFEESGIPLAGELEIFDANDRLLFMLSDALPHRMRPSDDGEEPFTWLEEIRIRLQNEDRYVYVVSDYKGERTSKKYVNYDVDSALVMTDFYSLKANPKNFLDWQNFRYFNFKDKEKESLLDSLKFRISGSILGSYTKITLSNKNLRAEQTAVHGGAIRLMVLLKTVVHIAKIPVLSLQVQVHFYPKSVVSHSRTKTPGIISSLYTEPALRISLDGNDLRGSHFYSTDGYQGKVDGALSRQELGIQNLAVSATNNWMLLAHPDNFLLLTQIELPVDTKSPISLVYEDDLHLRDKPERFLGQLPNIGYFVQELPMDKLFYLSFSMYFDDRGPAFDPKNYLARFKQPFEVQSISLH